MSWFPVLPSSGPYAGTTLNPGVDPAVYVLCGLVAFLLGCGLLALTGGLTVLVDPMWRRMRGVRPSLWKREIR